MCTLKATTEGSIDKALKAGRQAAFKLPMAQGNWSDLKVHTKEGIPGTVAVDARCCSECRLS